MNRIALTDQDVIDATVVLEMLAPTLDAALESGFYITTPFPVILAKFRGTGFSRPTQIQLTDLELGALFEAFNLVSWMTNGGRGVRPIHEKLSTAISQRGSTFFGRRALDIAATRAGAAGWFGLDVVKQRLTATPETKPALEIEPKPAAADEFQELIKAGERGDVDAQVRLSVAYRTGQGSAQDDERAVHWARRAAEQGNDRGQALLASAYAEGRGVPKDAVAAAGWYRRSAEQGNAIAQRQLAIAYINGEGVQRNANEAVNRYRAAADQGDVIAQIGLGVSYYRGDGVLQDYAQAAKWYERAAAYGDQNAQGRLADLYARGVGVSQDEVTALMWLILAGVDVSDDNREIIPANRARLTASLTSSDVAEAERRAMAWEPRTWPSDPIKDGLLRLLPRRRATVRPQQPR